MVVYQFGSGINVVVCTPHISRRYLSTYLPTFPTLVTRGQACRRPLDRIAAYPGVLNVLLTHILLNLKHTIFKPNP